MDTRQQLVVAAALAALALSGCRSCDEGPKTTAQALTAVEPGRVAAQNPATVVAEAAPVTPVYAGPSSRAADGFQLSTGFLDVTGKPLPQPKSLVPNAIYTTALDPAGHPLGALDRVGAAEMVGFLLARDLRHALVASADAPVRDGADARALTFAPPGGGDHALVVVFRPPGDAMHAVISPVSVSGNLPQLMGPGLAGLSLRAEASRERLQMVLLPADRTPAAPLDLQFVDIDHEGHLRGQVAVPFAVLVDPPMGRAVVLEPASDSSLLRWKSPEPGEWLVLVAPKKGERALAFHLTIPLGADKK